jgi:hypothetical protein
VFLSVSFLCISKVSHPFFLILCLSPQSLPICLRL